MSIVDFESIVDDPEKINYINIFQENIKKDNIIKSKVKFINNNKQSEKKND